MNLLQRGLTDTFRGLRTADANLILMGSALLFIVYLRATRPTRARVYKKKLRKGDAMVVRFASRGAQRLDTSSLR